ncbi:cdkn1a interacting zinc finger protein 1b isoform X2 [Mastacembelus armatus]|uniref:cdkn1a interacting zinc finger protein 1b isoform X2 n=1 Tax=Mastacembelus armatus TaxID=205130 RepID=UPI000E46050F|nr:cip1-interacting zinc finger protein-like isoform X2 [Mastacembelus armatus]
MGKQQRRTDRCFLHSPGNAVSRVQFPVGPVQKRQPPPQQVSGRKWAGPGTGSADSWPCSSSSTTTEKERGDPGPAGGLGELESKRAKLDGSEEAVLLTNKEKDQGSCGQPGSNSCSAGEAVLAKVPAPDQQRAAEHSEDSRAAELQTVGSLKVTIQRSSESREFGQTDRTADRQTGGLHCHVCDLSCSSLQVFQEHMSGSGHLKKLQQITHSICITTNTLQQRGRRPAAQRWCDTCQIHFSGNVIVHRRTEQHKMCKQLCRPFCPVCRRHFRTPRKFVEHMKSPEHKQQVQLEDAQEEELITVDAVGCFEGEEEEEEGVVVADEDDEESEEKVSETVDPEGTDNDVHECCKI